MLFSLDNWSTNIAFIPYFLAPTTSESNWSPIAAVFSLVEFNIFNALA